jgi:hypothetical protein
MPTVSNPCRAWSKCCGSWNHGDIFYRSPVNQLSRRLATRHDSRRPCTPPPDLADICRHPLKTIVCGNSVWSNIGPCRRCQTLVGHGRNVAGVGITVTFFTVYIFQLSINSAVIWQHVMTAVVHAHPHQPWHMPPPIKDDSMRQFRATSDTRCNRAARRRTLSKPVLAHTLQSQTPK